MAIRTKTVSFGLVFLAIGAGGVAVISQQSGWHPGTATVERVTKQCKMEATERGVLSKTTFTAEIDCGDVGVFELLHADKTWRSTPVYTGRVSVERDGIATTAEMPLSASGSREPQRGDTFAVIQDPADPAKVALASQAGMYPIITGVCGLLGALCVWLGFGAPMLRRRQSIADPDSQYPPDGYTRQPGPTPDIVSPPAPARTTYVPPPRQPAIVSGRRTFGKRGA